MKDKVNPDKKFTLILEVSTETGNPSLEDVRIFVNKIIERGYTGKFDFYKVTPMIGVSLKLSKITELSK